jgi:nucleotide-binding universal stress UspA family protein
MHRRGSYHLILVADGSRATDAAVTAVRSLIDPAAIGRISVVAVGYPFAFAHGWSLGFLGFAGFATPLLLDDLATRAKTWADTETQRVADLLAGESVALDRIARVGTPIDEIMDIARKADADIVVVSSNSRPGRFASSRDELARDLMHRLPCPVLVVHPRAADAPPVRGQRIPALDLRLSRSSQSPLVAGAGA